MKRVLILGLGVSGRAAAKLLISQGYRVAAFDEKQKHLEAHPEILKLRAEGLELFSGKEEFDLLVPSPGVAPNHPLYLRALQQNLEICGEAELAFRQMKNSAVAITGTNGKTTVTLLVEHILKASGRKARALGNVGEPLATYFLNPDPEEIIVAELSSYQLETMHSRVFDAAVLLNITPDHLDRYPSMQEYARAKCRLQHCMKQGAPFFVQMRVLAEFGEYVEPGALPLPESVEYLWPLGYRGIGGHERENALAAWLIVKELGVTDEQFLSAFESFRKPAHRIEFVESVEGIRYFDDSKGTNLDAVIQAVKSMEGPVILIAGGVDKGAPYTPWIEAFQNRVKRIFSLGEAAPKIEADLGEAFHIERVDSLSEAVRRAHTQATEGDCVLLSPGCASFDMFRDYAHRGEEFKRVIHDLKQERSKKL